MLSAFSLYSTAYLCFEDATAFRYTFAIYQCVDFCWLLIDPTCSVLPRMAVFMHHIVTIALTLSHSIYPWAAIGVELNQAIRCVRPLFDCS